MKAILKYPGAKNRLADWIIQFIPEHKVYLEPYFGSGAVFFSKAEAKIETINDTDCEVVNLFRIIREYPDELAKATEMTPYSRVEYEKAYYPNAADTEIEKARKFLIRCWLGMGNSNTYRNGFRTSQQSSGPKTTKHWGELPERILLAAERLKNAQIENLDALELLKRYDTKDVFVYLDPPYLPDMRKQHLYKYEMTTENHIKLLNTIKTHPGRILLSGYDNELYNKILNDWNKAEKQTQAECGIKRTETLWYNYEMDKQMTLTQE